MGVTQMISTSHKDSELVIKETQLGLKTGIKVNPNDLNEVDIDDCISGPTCPPGFEVFLRKDTDRLLQDKGYPQIEQEVVSELGHKRNTKKNKKKEKQQGLMRKESMKQGKIKKKEKGKKLQKVIQQDSCNTPIFDTVDCAYDWDATFPNLKIYKL
ncbi:hypothetical protein PIB30_032358 [Stylosanthes scabra]|uniref:Uncharacterized protein n=1 Tax=Stylosanthes scabra TaxID=79078 RepID=A0ABU6TBT8_9FABA|nr:hypothetical protein [Stylosanthes scabra]